MTGLIAMPLKSSQGSGLLTQSFDLGTEELDQTRQAHVIPLQLTENTYLK